MKPQVQPGQVWKFDQFDRYVKIMKVNTLTVDVAPCDRDGNHSDAGYASTYRDGVWRRWSLESRVEYLNRFGRCGGYELVDAA